MQMHSLLRITKINFSGHNDASDIYTPDDLIT